MGLFSQTRENKKHTNWSINPSHLCSLVMCLEYIYICHIIWLTLPVFQPKPFDSCYRIHFFDMYVRSLELFLVIRQRANVFPALFINTKAF